MVKSKKNHIVLPVFVRVKKSREWLKNEIYEYFICYKYNQMNIYK